MICVISQLGNFAKTVLVIVKEKEVMIKERSLGLEDLLLSIRRLFVPGALVISLLLILASQYGAIAYAEGGDTGIGPSSEGEIAPSGPIVIGNTWHQFSHEEVGEAVKGCQPADPNGLSCIPGANSQFANAPPWTFNGPATFEVTDAFLRGESFDIFDFGIFVGSTPAVPVSGTCGPDPDPCWADPLSSSAAFDFGSGSHSITMVPNTIAFINGVGYFRLVPGVVAFTCDLSLSYGDGNLSIDLTIGTIQPAELNLYLAAMNSIFPLATGIPLPVIDPPFTVPTISFPLPPMGGVGVLVTMTTPGGGIICADWDLVNTGRPLSKGIGELKELRNSLQSVDGLIPSR